MFLCVGTPKLTNVELDIRIVVEAGTSETKTETWVAEIETEAI